MTKLQHSNVNYILKDEATTYQATQALNTFKKDLEKAAQLPFPLTDNFVDHVRRILVTSRSTRGKNIKNVLPSDANVLKELFLRALSIFKNSGRSFRQRILVSVFCIKRMT